MSTFFPLAAVGVGCHCSLRPPAQKPANILVMDRNCREPGIVKIADLGMARLFNSPLKVRGRSPPPTSPTLCCGATVATNVTH